MNGLSADITTPPAGPDQPPEAIKEDEFEPPNRPDSPQQGQPPPSSLPITSTASALQSFVDRALYFFGHASNEALGACFAGLGFATYLLLGRVGLLAIGIAGGIVLHATWEGIRSDDRDEATRRADEERRRESGVEVARRILEWRLSGRDNEEKAQDFKVFIGQQLDHSTFGPETSSALTAFTDAVIQNYVHWWYDPVIPDEHSFPASCRRTFTAFALSLSGHLQRKRSADVFLDFVANASSIIIVFLTEISSALNASPNAPVDQAIATYLKLKPESSLSYMLDQESQKSKLANAAEDILQAYLDPKAYNCQPVHAFLKSVLAHIVLGYSVDSCSRPEWINDWIVYGLEESQTTKEVMEIVDAGVQRGAKDTSGSVGTAAEVDQQKTPMNSTGSGKPVTEHRRQMSRAEEAMDEAMREARRLTELMIAEDQRLAKENKEKESLDAQRSSTEGASERMSAGASTPTSSHSDVDKVEGEDVPSRDLGSPIADKEPTLSPTVEQFTNFDQIVPRNQPTALSVDDLDKPNQILTFQNAYIEILVGVDEEQSPKANPNIDYMIQITPAAGSAGWMIFRKYADFEKLHGNLFRISKVTSANQFSIDHPVLPNLKHQTYDKAKAQTKAVLRVELQEYLRNAVLYQPLAECIGMKSFLSQDMQLNKSPNSAAKGFWPTPVAFSKLGGEMIGALSKAPKQVTGGRKAIIGGVTSLVGASKRQSQSQVSLDRPLSTTIPDDTSTEGHMSQPSVDQARISEHGLGSLDVGRMSHDSLANSPLESYGDASAKKSLESGWKPDASPVRPRSVIEGNDSQTSLSQSAIASKSSTAAPGIVEDIELPPPPSEMPPDYVSPSRKKRSDSTPQPIDQRLKGVSESEGLPPPTPPRPKPAPRSTSFRPKEALSERETSIAIELIFAVVTQLYTLSSAWQFRRTLLAAAKAYLLRPGNLQLISIKDLLQTSLLDSNLSDEGLAHHISKLRANALPTEEEMEVWKRDYPEKSAEKKEELRIKARRLLVTKGMPQALTSVMGAAASGEALGKVFDCLQIPEVSRGLIYGLLLQALRVITN